LPGFDVTAADSGAIPPSLICCSTGPFWDAQPISHIPKPKTAIASSRSYTGAATAQPAAGVRVNQGQVGGPLADCSPVVCSAGVHWLRMGARQFRPTTRLPGRFPSPRVHCPRSSAAAHRGPRGRSKPESTRSSVWSRCDPLAGPCRPALAGSRRRGAHGRDVSCDALGVPAHAADQHRCK
jgi:hypothetical protein